MQVNKRVEGQWRPSQWVNATYFLIGVFAIVCGSMAAMQGLDTGLRWLDMMVHTVWVGGLMLLVWKYLEIRCTRYELSGEQFTATHGVLSRLTDNLELYRIKDTQVIEPFWLRALGLGNVCIHSSDKTTPILLVRAITQPAAMAISLRAQVEAERVRKGVREFD